MAGGILWTCLRLTRRSKLTFALVSHSSQDQTVIFDVYKCECHMSKFKLASSPWCAPEEPTHGPPLERTFRVLKPSPDDRTRPTLEVPWSRSHCCSVLSGRAIPTTIHYDFARDRTVWAVAWLVQKDWAGRSCFGRAVWAHERPFGRQHF